MSNGNMTPPRGDDGDDYADRRPPRPRNFTGVALVLLVLVILWLVIQNHMTEPKKEKLPKLIECLALGKVEEIEVEKDIIRAKLKKSAQPIRVDAPQDYIVSILPDLEELGEMGREANKSKQKGEEAENMLWLLADRAAKGEPAEFLVDRRYKLRIKDKDKLLVRMTRPALTSEDDAPTGRKDYVSTGTSVSYLFEPGQIHGKDGTKSYDITFPRLLELTAPAEINARHGLPSPDAVTKDLLASKGIVEFKPDDSLMTTIIISLLPWVLIIAFLWFFIFRQMRSNGMGGNVLAFGRSRARVANREKSNVTFADVAGIDEAKDEVEEIVEFLKHPGRFSRLGGRIPRGVLLVGSPGTGKTLLAKAIAGEAEVPFFSICGSDFVEMFVGVGASRVRDLFKQARENSPCIVFLDEIDAVGRRRGAGLGGGHDEREQTLNAILVEMDGFETDVGIIVIAATNRADVLDPALLRPGRFDREIAVDLPDVKGREAILRVHAKRVKVHPGVDLSRIARGTPGFSGAELEAVVNEAAILATLAKKDYVDEADLEEARDRVRWGRAKTSRIMDEEDQRVTAFHEAGHTLAALLLPGADPLHKVTIIPRGQALGATMYLPEKDQYNLTLEKAKAHLQICFGGRIAEELFCGDITSGAANDIKQATMIARRMVREWGMSERVGPISYEENEDTVFIGREIGRQTSHSESINQIIDEEVKRIVDQAYEACHELLASNRDKLRLLAETLLEYEVLTREEIEGLVAGETVEEVRERLEDVKKSVEREAEATPASRPEPPPPPVVEPEPDFPPGLAGEGA